MGIKVSVIIPMYNVSGLIEPCVKSLCNQTYKDIELIFINDCSKDETIQVLNDLLAKHHSSNLECKIISHDMNRGVAAARNTGLNAATGDYIYSVDADDYIEPDTIESLVKETYNGGKDIVSCEWLLEFGTNARHMVQPNFMTGEDLFRQMCYGKARWNLWLFLVRRSLFEDNHIRFVPGVNMGEDMMVMLKMSLLADKTAVVHRPLYHYIQTNVNAISKDIRPYLGQIKDNVAEVEKYVNGHFGDRYDRLIDQLKLSLKLPLLISDKKKSYIQWLELWPETNCRISDNPEISWRTRIIQGAASKKMFIILYLYYWCVIKFVYGILYK